MSIEESSVTNSSQEPSNTTKAIGLKLKKVLYTSNQSDVSDYKTYLNDDGYYFGVQLLKSEVESGFYAPTGTASIDEEVDYGYSLVTGTNISDMISSARRKSFAKFFNLESTSFQAFSELLQKSSIFSISKS